MLGYLAFILATATLFEGTLTLATVFASTASVIELIVTATKVSL